jgi:hypothetical protein
LPRLLLLVWSQVLPGFHALQDAILLLRRKSAETLQPLAQSLLPFEREIAELGIVVQRFLLLVGRKIFIPAQPLSGVILLPRRWLFLALLDALNPGLGHARRNCERQREPRGGCRQLRRDEF